MASQLKKKKKNKKEEEKGQATEAIEENCCNVINKCANKGLAQGDFLKIAYQNINY